MSPPRGRRRVFDAANVTLKFNGEIVPLVGELALEERGELEELEESPLLAYAREGED